MARTLTSVFTADGRSEVFLAALAAHFRCAEHEVEKHLAGHTFAVSVNDQMFIRSTAALGADKTSFFCDIEFGDCLHLLKVTDFIGTTQRDWQQFLSGKGTPLAMLLNDCVLRRLGNAAQLGQAAFFAETPAAAFRPLAKSWHPINQTLSALVFFKKRRPYRRFHERLPGALPASRRTTRSAPCSAGSR